MRIRLDRLVQDKRADEGIRACAKKIGVSPSTLSRIERGQLPDILTFSKICTWLQVDPNDVLGVSAQASVGPEQQVPREPGAQADLAPAVHFKVEATWTEEAAKDLAQLIFAAQREMLHRFA
jgi:transcriptional regulator with XRE-family HTH domain